MDQPVRKNHLLNTVSRYFQIIFMGLVLLYFGKTLFIPLFFGLLVAIIFYPFCKWLEKKKWPRSLAVAAIITLVIILFGTLLWLLGYELNLFLDDIPLIRLKLLRFSAELSSWLGSTLGMQQSLQDSLWDKFSSGFGKNMEGYLRSTLTATASTVFMLILIPIYSALFLYSRETFVRFLESIVGDKYKERFHTILAQTLLTYFRFIKGTFMVYCIVGVLNSIGLFALGIKHAILFGMITAFMTAIPYVGILISASLPVSVALITKDSIGYAIGVVAVFAFVQYLEANIIFPRIVGQQLNLSTWSVLVAIVAGGLLWGISGMILFVPFAAILKIVSDYVEEWQPLNTLLKRD